MSRDRKPSYYFCDTIIVKKKMHDTKHLNHLRISSIKINISVHAEILVERIWEILTFPHKGPCITSCRICANSNRSRFQHLVTYLLLFIHRHLWSANLLLVAMTLTSISKHWCTCFLFGYDVTLDSKSIYVYLRVSPVYYDQLLWEQRLFVVINAIQIVCFYICGISHSIFQNILYSCLFQ